MDTLTIILLAAAAFGLLGLAWLGGYETGHDAGSDAERALCNTRIKGILRSQKVSEIIDYENNRRPKAAKNRRKAARKAVLA